MPASKTSRKTGAAGKKAAAKKRSSVSSKKVAVKRTLSGARKTAARKSFVRPGTGAWEKILATLLDSTLRPKDRLQALSQLGEGVTADRKAFDAVVRVLGDTSADSKLRDEALSMLQGATFDTSTFARYRPAYLKALRALRTDHDLELRQRAFGILAREQDADTQDALIAGFDDPDRALLPPEKALQLLSYDPHAGAYGVARKIEKAPPNPLARREALRVLAGDAESVKLFERVLGDKGEPTEIRQLAASALNHLAPKRMQAMARDMALDANESDEVKTVCLTALANFGDPEALMQDTELQQQVDRYQQGGAEQASPLKVAAATFKRRYG